MKEVIFEEGGRPLYIDDLKNVQDSALLFEKVLVNIIAKINGDNQPTTKCVLCGCKVSVSYVSSSVGYVISISEGYVLINGHIRYVKDTVSTGYSTSTLASSKCFVITASNGNSEQLIKYKDGNEYSICTNYVATVECKSISESEEASDNIVLTVNSEPSDRYASKDVFEGLFFQHTNTLIEETQADADKIKPVAVTSLNTIIDNVTSVSSIVNSKNNYKYILVDSDNVPLGISEIHYRNISPVCIVQTFLGSPSIIGVTEETDPAIHLYVRFYNISGSQQTLSDGTGWPNYSWTNWVRSDKDIADSISALSATVETNRLTAQSDDQSILTQAKAYTDTAINTSAIPTDSNIANIKATLSTKASIEYVDDLFKQQAESLVGEIKMWAGSASSIPSNFLLCDGRVLEKDDYPDLYTVLSTTYNASKVGDGTDYTGTISTNQFRLPDLRGRFIVGQGDATINNEYQLLGTTGGEKKHKLSAAESGLPAHTHPFKDYYYPENSTLGSQHGQQKDSRTFGTDTISTIEWGNDGGMAGDADVLFYYKHDTENATAQEASAEHENRPPFFTLAYIIRAKNNEVTEADLKRSTLWSLIQEADKLGIDTTTYLTAYNNTSLTATELQAYITALQTAIEEASSN